MYDLPPIDLAVRISKIINRNKGKLKEYQDRHGKVNLNLLIGMILGSICSFEEKPMINNIIKLFSEVIVFNSNNQFKEFADLVIKMNNYLTQVLDSNSTNIYVLEEDNKWVLITKATVDNMYAFWYSFYGIMKVEFEQNSFKEFKSISTYKDAMEAYGVMQEIMQSTMLDDDKLTIMYQEFPGYAHRFNELRKLMYMQTVASQSTLH